MTEGASTRSSRECNCTLLAISPIVVDEEGLARERKDETEEAREDDEGEEVMGGDSEGEREDFGVRLLGATLGEGVVGEGEVDGEVEVGLEGEEGA